MAKPQELHIDGYDYFFWPYEEQTRMKHKVLREYFSVWATKLGKFSEVNFFDCHGGCGAYWANNEPYWGSSVLVAQVAAELKKRLGRKTNIYVSESDHNNAENLKKVIAAQNMEIPPKVAEITFEDVVAHPGCVKLYKSLPSFFFIDPFGYSLDFSNLQSIMQYPKNELLINFMFDYINRFISLPDQAENFDRLFGCKDWREAILLTELERETKLVEIFKRQLKQLAKYVFPYKLSFYDKARTYYYLFHVTNHLDGCNLMKSCFATLNNGKVEYLGNRSDIITLFDLQEVKLQEIKEYLNNRFYGKSITFTGIVEAVIDDTFFLEKDIRAALKELRADGKINVRPVTSKQISALSGEDIVSFGEVKS